jgi:hypothetical protein
VPGRTVPARTVAHDLAVIAGWLAGSAGSQPDGQTMATTSFQTVRLWSVAEATSLVELAGHSDWVRSCSFSSDGTVLATGCASVSSDYWGLGIDIARMKSGFLSIVYMMLQTSIDAERIRVRFHITVKRLSSENPAAESPEWVARIRPGSARASSRRS